MRVGRGTQGAVQRKPPPLAGHPWAGRCSVAQCQAQSPEGSGLETLQRHQPNRTRDHPSGMSSLHFFTNSSGQSWVGETVRHLVLSNWQPAGVTNPRAVLTSCPQQACHSPLQICPLKPMCVSPLPLSFLISFLPLFFPPALLPVPFLYNSNNQTGLS